MISRRSALLIGEVASSSGLTVDAVRYYERMGLLEHQARTSGGFRTYSTDVVDRLAFIRQAQTLGLRLKDVRELLGASGRRGRNGCEQVRSLLVRRLADVETQMKELKSFRRTLRSALDNCDAALTLPSVDQCPVVSSLSPSPKKRPRR